MLWYKVKQQPEPVIDIKTGSTLATMLHLTIDIDIKKRQQFESWRQTGGNISGIQGPEKIPA